MNIGGIMEMKYEMIYIVKNNDVFKKKNLECNMLGKCVLF